MHTDTGARPPLAIVGIGCRLPGGEADSAAGLWDLLCSETDATRVVPESRWNADRYHDPNPAKVGKIVTRRGGFLSSIDQFDPQFFGMSPREAHSLDPQQRLLLHVAWEALEDGGAARRPPGGRRRGRVHRGGFHARLSAAAEPGPHQSLPVQVAFGHRHDDDDAGQPYLTRFRLPRAQRDRRHRVLRIAGRRTPCRAKHLEW